MIGGSVQLLTGRARAQPRRRRRPARGPGDRAADDVLTRWETTASRLHDGAEFAAPAPPRLWSTTPALLGSIEHDADAPLPAQGRGRSVRCRSTLGFPPSSWCPRIVGRTADGRGWVIELGCMPAAPVPGRTDRAHGVGVFDAPRAQGRGRRPRAIERGELAKVVLSRAVSVTADAAFDRRAVLRGCAQQPGASSTGRRDGRREPRAPR
jgi:hypothetical protein